MGGEGGGQGENHTSVGLSGDFSGAKKRKMKKHIAL